MNYRPPQDTQQESRDRLITLEIKVDHLTDKLDGMTGKVDELHTLLIQARGLKWFVWAIAAIFGFVSAKLSYFMQWPR